MTQLWRGCLMLQTRLLPTGLRGTAVANSEMVIAPAGTNPKQAQTVGVPACFQTNRPPPTALKYVLGKASWDWAQPVRDETPRQPLEGRSNRRAPKCNMASSSCLRTSGGRCFKDPVLEPANGEDHQCSPVLNPYATSLKHLSSTIRSQSGPPMKLLPFFRILATLFDAFAACVVASVQSRASTQFHAIMGLNGAVFPPGSSDAAVIVELSKSSLGCFRPFVYLRGKRENAP